MNNFQKYERIAEVLMINATKKVQIPDMCGQCETYKNPLGELNDGMF